MVAEPVPLNQPTDIRYISVLDIVLMPYSISHRIRLYLLCKEMGVFLPWKHSAL